MQEESVFLCKNWRKSEKFNEKGEMGGMTRSKIFTQKSPKVHFFEFLCFFQPFLTQTNQFLRRSIHPNCPNHAFYLSDYQVKSR